jgi:hypothetical protein
VIPKSPTAVTHELCYLGGRFCNNILPLKRTIAVNILAQFRTAWVVALKGPKTDLNFSIISHMNDLVTLGTQAVVSKAIHRRTAVAIAPLLRKELD